MTTRKHIISHLFWVIIIVTLMTFAPFWLRAQTVDDLIVMTEHYPPFNFQKNGKSQGISVDLFDLMLEKTGSNLTRADIKILPWARAYREVQSTKNTCLFSMTRTKEREDLFKWVGPIAPTVIALTAKKDRKLAVNSIEDVKRYRIGVIRDDIAAQLLYQAGIGKNNLEETANTDSIMRMLDSGRIDLWAYEENVAKWDIKSKGKAPNDYETVYVLKQSELYFAFHKELPDSLIQELQKALDELKEEGKYDKIIDTYLGDAE